MVLLDRMDGCDGNISEVGNTNFINLPSDSFSASNRGSTAYMLAIYPRFLA